jgi:hypothetical protein
MQIDKAVTRLHPHMHEANSNKKITDILRSIYVDVTLGVR